ncbi:programmed cell death 1 ligand 1 isoform X1 [Arapaima gigas]
MHTSLPVYTDYYMQGLRQIRGRIGSLLQAEIDMAHLLLLQMVLMPSVKALFTVEVSSPSYTAEFRGDVVMECKFSPMNYNASSLSVYWHRIDPMPSLGVYSLQNRQEDFTFPNSHFHGRVQLMKDKLSSGRAILNISNLRINDSGTYQCFVEMVGADYKHTTLTVKASYKSIKKTVRRAGNDEVELSCESEGYPLTTLVWNDQRGRRIDNVNVSSVTTLDQLFHITSSVTVDSSTNNYTCTVVEEGHMGPSAAFLIPEEIPGTKSGKPPSNMAWLMLVVIAMMIVGFLLYHRRKGNAFYFCKPSKEFLYTQLSTLFSSAGLTQEKNDDVQVAIEVDEVNVEALRKVLMNTYEVLSTQTEVSHLRVFCENELPRRLRNREGLAVGVTSLLPGVRETVLLEEEHGSDKMTVAHSLASAWAEDSQWDPFGVRRLPLLVLVACEGAEDDLFWQAASQLGQKNWVTARGLRRLLTGSVDSLLVLDGYTEGCQKLDESLTTFLQDRKMCRVLITARLGQCGSLIHSCRTVLKLCNGNAGNEGLS